MLKNVAAILLDGVHPFELGVVCEVFGLDRSEAFALVEQQLEIVHAHWDEAADRARLTEADRRSIFGGAILNPSILYDWDGARPRPLRPSGPPREAR